MRSKLEHTAPTKPAARIVQGPALVKRLALLASVLVTQIAFASSEQVEFPGARGNGFPAAERITATLALPDGVKAPMPAVVLLHGSSGIDGRGAFHAEALNKAGIATLEVLMFAPGERFKEGHATTLTHAYGALQYLASRPDIDAKRIGVMGFSWGGNVSLRTASKSTHQAFFPNGGPSFAAHAPYYAVWWAHSKILKSADTAQVYSELTGAPVMLVAGGKDEYGDTDAAQQFINALPETSRQYVSLEYYPNATHGFDSPPGRDRTLFDPYAANGKGARVRFQRDADAAEDARAKTVVFFLKSFDRAAR